MKQQLLLISLVLLILPFPVAIQGQTVYSYEGGYYFDVEVASINIELPDDSLHYVIVDNTGILNGNTEDRPGVNYTLDVDYDDYQAGSPTPPIDEIISTIGAGTTYKSFLEAGEYSYEVINDSFAEEGYIRRTDIDFESNGPLTVLITNSTGFENFKSRVENYTPATGSISLNSYIFLISVLFSAIILRSKRNIR